MRVFLLGYPGEMGGANTECWHTVRAWRAVGLDVTLIPTWGCDRPWEERLDAAGCRTIHVNQDSLHTVDGLRGGIVVGMCNSNVVRARGVLSDLQTKVVWVNCMTFQFDDEIRASLRYGPMAAYVFQSRFQREELEKSLLKQGYKREQGHLIPGPFFAEDIPFSPNDRNGEFVIGRLARPDMDKWSSNLWPILSAVPCRDRRALCMGWTRQLEAKCGTPPAWAECLPPHQIPVEEFLGRCHALLCLNGGARENWPRVGLEAMAAGVPVVAENAWGWKEMIEHGHTGFLCDDDDDRRYYLAHLGRDDALRRRIAVCARERVEEIASPAFIGRQWLELFESLI